MYRSPVVIVKVKDGTAAEYEHENSLPIVSMHKDDFANVHTYLPPATSLTESSLPVRAVVDHYEQRLHELEDKYNAQKARQDRMERALADANTMLLQHSLALNALKEKLGVE